MPPQFVEPQLSLHANLSDYCLCAKDFTSLSLLCSCAGRACLSCITMTPPRTMTGDTFVADEKTPQSPISPTNTDDTLRDEAFVEVVEDSRSTIRPSDSSIDIESAQPGR